MRGRGPSSRAPLLPGSGPLSKVRPIAVFLVVLALFVVGVLVRGPIGAVLLGALVLGMLGLLGATWRALSAPDRALRVLVLFVLVGVTVSVVR